MSNRDTDDTIPTAVAVAGVFALMGILLWKHKTEPEKGHFGPRDMVIEDLVRPEL